jgi:hypothetical protein
MRVTARASWRYSGSAVNPPSCAALRPRPNRFSWEEFATKTAQPPRALAGSRAPPRFVMRSPLQFPRSAAAPPQRPRNADRSGSYANTVCGPRSQNPSRRSHTDENGCKIDRNNHEGHAAQTKRISSDVTSQRKPRPCRRPEQNRRHRSRSQAQKCRRNALTNGGIFGLKSEGSRTM